MSSKGRTKAARKAPEADPSEFYRTPFGAVRVLFAAAADPSLGLVGQILRGFIAALQQGPVWELNAGEGDIIDHVQSLLGPVLWRAVELRPEAAALCAPHIERGRPGSSLVTGDCFAELARMRAAGERGAAMVGNPAFSLALREVVEALPLCDYVCILQRAQWISDSRERRAVFRDNAPIEFRLGRLDFDGRGGDSTVYSWFLWPPELRGLRYAPLVVLEPPTGAETKGRQPTTDRYQLTLL